MSKVMWVNALSVKQVRTLGDFHTSSPLAYFLKSKKRFCCCCCCSFICLFNQTLLSVLETSKLGQRRRKGGSVLLLTHILHKTWQRRDGYFTLHIHDSQAHPFLQASRNRKKVRGKWRHCYYWPLTWASALLPPHLNRQVFTTAELTHVSGMFKMFFLYGKIASYLVVFDIKVHIFTWNLGGSTIISERGRAIKEVSVINKLPACNTSSHNCKLREHLNQNLALCFESSLAQEESV